MDRGTDRNLLVEGLRRGKMMSEERGKKKGMKLDEKEGGRKEEERERS